MNVESKARSFLIPRYNELSLFLMSCSILGLFLIDPELRAAFRETIAEDKFDPRIYFALGMFALGMFFSILHLFLHRAKSEWEKDCMLFFAIFVNGISGVAGGLHVLSQEGNLLFAIFPLWNLSNGILLIIMYRIDVISEKTSIVDDNTTISQATLGLMIIATTIAISHLMFQQYWALTFSMCVAYASNLDRLIQGIGTRQNS